MTTLVLILAGILAAPAFLLQILTAPLIAILVIPALSLLIFRKEKHSSSSSSSLSSTSCAERLVIVTGGSSGIGLAMAKGCARRSDVKYIIIIARNQEKLDQAKQAIEAVRIDPTRQTVHSFSVDITDPSAVATAARDIFQSWKSSPSSDPKAEAKDAENRLPPMTNLFCCAGEATPGYFEQIPTEVFVKQVQVNQLGTMFFVQAMLPYMHAGTITLCSSTVGQLGVFGYTAYGPTKFALRGFAEVLHMELSKRPIHVQVAFPMDTDTPGFARENETKPAETRLISGSANFVQPETIAQTMIRQAFCSTPPFYVYFDMDSFLVCQVTAGMSPVTTWLDALAQVSAMHLIRLVSFFYLKLWHGIIREYQSQQHPGTTPPPMTTATKESSTLPADSFVGDPSVSETTNTTTTTYGSTAMVANLAETEQKK